jgi:hypothetical protein
MTNQMWGSNCTIMVKSTEMFMQSLQEWLRAVRADDFDGARTHAESLVHHGERLVKHADFQRAFENHCHGVDPKETLFQFCQFLVSATEGREEALKAWIDVQRR